MGELKYLRTDGTDWSSVSRVSGYNAHIGCELRIVASGKADSNTKPNVNWDLQRIIIH